MRDLDQIRYLEIYGDDPDGNTCYSEHYKVEDLFCFDELEKLINEHFELVKQLANGINFIDKFIPFACPYEVDINDDYITDWEKCHECGYLRGQQLECWKEYFKEYGGKNDV